MGSRIRSPLSRSYGGILPSSFTTILSIALVFSTYPPVSVWGTGGSQLAHEAFLGSIGSPTPGPKSKCHHVSAYMPHGFANVTAYALSPRQPSRGMGYLPASLRSLPTTGSGHRLNQPDTPKGGTEGLACLVSPASARALLRRYQNINWLSIDYACRPRLRSRLTQGRLA